MSAVTKSNLEIGCTCKGEVSILLYCSFSVPHEITYFVGCFENGTTVVQFDFDGEEILYVDLQREEVVFTVPVFIDPDPMQVLIGLSILKDALDNREWCSALQRMFQYKNKSPPKEGKHSSTLVFCFNNIAKMLMKIVFSFDLF